MITASPLPIHPATPPLTSLAPDSSTSFAVADPGRRVERGLVLALSLWGLAAWTAARFGFFAALPPDSIAAFVVAGVVLPTWAYLRLPGLRAYLLARGPKGLTVFHLWRLPVGILFLHWGAQGFLPPRFTFNAGWGDVLAGLLVPVVLLLPGEGRGKYWFFHLVGFADLVLAVGTGLTFTLMRVHPMENIALYPAVLIPVFGVGVSAASHLITFHMLLGAGSPTRLAGTPLCHCVTAARLNASS